MRRKMLKAVLLFSFYIFTTSGGEAFAAMISYGPQSFTNSSGVISSKFNPSVGNLTSITYKITDGTIYDTRIFDVDDNSGSFSFTNASYSYTFQIGVTGIIGTNYLLSGSTLGDDDGDGIGSYDGGVDEVKINISDAGLQGETIVSDPALLIPYIGTGPIGILLSAYNNGGTIFTGRNIEQYSENFSASGNFELEYHYDPVPIPSSILFLLSGGLSLFSFKRLRKS